jgi:large conductance mechanosensitive channel
MIADFRAYLTKSNALALAVGVIIGAAIGSVVSALVADLLMPVISLALPGGSWRDAKFVLRETTDASGKITETALLYGHFLGVLLDFLIIALVTFFIVRSLVRAAPSPPAPPTKQCPECLEVVPAAARRCRACGMVLV